MIRRTVRGVAMATLLVAAVACSGDAGGTAATIGDSSVASDTSAPGDTSSSSAPSAEPVPGGPCDQADAVTDIAGVQYRCMLQGQKTLVWLPADSPSGGGAGNGNNEGLASSDDIPKAIENWGFDLQPFDPATGMAGVMKITGATTPPPDPHNRMDTRYLFIDYGNGEDRATDLQAAFFLPLGTPVVAMVSGVVCDVPKLYSGDYSVRIAPTGVECSGPGHAAVMFETEHVLDPVVQQGDTVTAGQQVATVSDYQKGWKPLGFGIVEIGVAFNKSDGSGKPWHACPARFLDPAKAQELTDALASIHAAWEAESGDTSLYDEAAQPVLGCTTLDDIQG